MGKLSKHEISLDTLESLFTHTNQQNNLTPDHGVKGSMLV